MFIIRTSLVLNPRNLKSNNAEGIWLHATNNYIVDRNMNYFNEKSNKTHDEKSNSCGSSYSGKF